MNSSFQRCIYYVFIPATRRYRAEEIFCKLEAGHEGTHKLTTLARELYCADASTFGFGLKAGAQLVPTDHLKPKEDESADLY